MTHVPPVVEEIMGKYFFHEEFPPFITQQSLHINALELLTIVVVLKIWGKKLRGKKVLIFTDNMSSCHVINRGVSKDSFHQSYLREIFYIASVNEFTIKTQHTRGEDNRLADILSHGHLNRNSEALFREQMGVTEGSRVPVDNDLFQFSNPW